MGYDSNPLGLLYRFPTLSLGLQLSLNHITISLLSNAKLFSTILGQIKLSLLSKFRSYRFAVIKNGSNFEYTSTYSIFVGGQIFRVHKILGCTNKHLGRANSKIVAIFSFHI